MIAVFDIGNVLLRWNPRFLFRDAFADDARMERFLATACSPDWIAEADRRSDFSAAVDERTVAWPEFARELRLFDTHWIRTIGSAIEENVALLERLRAMGRPVHAVTNFAAAKFEVARAVYPFMDLFDVAIVSGREGMAKPDRRMFDLLYERTGRSPKELVFVDDSLANVLSARATGMAAIHFTPGVDVEAELRKHGVFDAA